MSRMTHRLAVLGVVCGLALAAVPGAAGAGAGTLPSPNTECVVQHVDERGGVTGTTRAREGSVYGQFRCAGGQWELTRTPFERGDAVASREIQVDREGNVSARQIVGPALTYGMTLAQMSRLAQAVTGEGMTVEKAVVAVDDGRVRTPEEVRALLAGRDTTGARVLGVIDRPDLALSVDDLVGDVGGTPGSTVVYFSLWGAIKRAVAWVVDVIEDVGEWIHEHCTIQPAIPPDMGFDFSCRWSW